MAITTSLDQDQRQTREMCASGIWRKSKNSWARKFPEISFFFTPSPDATHHSSMKLARQQAWRNLRMYFTSKNKLTSSAIILRFPTAGEKALVSLFGGKPGVGLNNLRYQRYFGKTCKQDVSYWPTESAPNSSCCSISQPARLPAGKAVTWRRCWHIHGKLAVESH